MPAGVSWPRYLRMFGASYYRPDLVSMGTSILSVPIRRPFTCT
uniref:Uncharacterized protein n=1 Tax=Hucho hucho TaxID=62062 RepID=A0A4W5LSG1_9TELE